MQEITEISKVEEIKKTNNEVWYKTAEVEFRAGETSIAFSCHKDINDGSGYIFCIAVGDLSLGVEDIAGIYYDLVGDILIDKIKIKLAEGNEITFQAPASFIEELLNLNEEYELNIELENIHVNPFVR
tara:strand:+ start:5998 stop:6381 length:384 start_codon:yes stop_codon:yes gene_type:complete